MAVKQQNRKNNILLGQNNNALTWLVIINAVAFVILLFIKVVYENIYPSKGPVTGDGLFQTEIVSWLALPADFHTLGSRPWALLSYMFVHLDVLQFVSNLFWLWSFGYILQDLSGNSKLIPIYLYGGLAGGLFYLLGIHIIPGYSHQLQNVLPFVSGSASVMAVAVATTVLSPNYKIFPMINGGIPLWALTTIFVIVEYATVATTNGGYATGHLGAAFTGVIFVYQLRRGHDLGAWMARFVDWVDDLFNPEKKSAEENAKQKLFYKAVKKPYIKKTVVTQQRVDELLDKINQQGYHFLTDEERDFLKKASEEDL
ncbi:MAG TPA: rhomboid family intramembrane serine protease [Chitinophagaceae bacterium]|nr:rhomboid family intramembrane serine protease [Chitinophagaceae bacterium]